jgi:hypothetical protein
MHHFSPSTLGFYLTGVHPSMPADAKPITAERYAEIMAGTSRGKRLAADAQGAPVLLDAPAPSVAALRRSAELQTTQLSNQLRERIAKASHYLQTTRWPVQVAAAQAIAAGAGSAFDVQMMALEARLRGRGETVEQLAAKVLANSAVFTLVGAAVDGIETATLDAIRAYAGTDPAAFAALLTQARLDAHAELLAIYTPVAGEAQAEALVAQILGA